MSHVWSKNINGTYVCIVCKKSKKKMGRIIGQCTKSKGNKLWVHVNSVVNLVRGMDVGVPEDQMFWGTKEEMVSMVVEKGDWVGFSLSTRIPAKFRGMK